MSDEHPPSKAPKMIVPSPRFDIGDRVESSRALNARHGEVIGRSYNNLLHAKQWRYRIRWDDGNVSNNHYCYDIRFEEYGRQQFIPSP